MKSSEIRANFLKFFESKGHTIVRSSSLVPANDKTLLFTNSGMVQFKDVFLGDDVRPYSRATTVQRCVRAGGKHNDLENVGYTARHHTFFEMLGNFSFGDYFKRDAINYAWELLTKVYQLPVEKLWVTVYQEDDEAYAIWANEVGVPVERIIRIGDNKGARYASDNFWSMGDTGPCGPCTEIFYDHGAEIFGGPPGSPDEDGDRYIEIWNLVFMQFNRDEKGTLTPLPKPCVDTGMGIERLSAVLQHVHSNYEIDLFQALIKAAARETGCTDLENKSLRVIADHIRATSFMIVDGVIPSSEGQGYVLRRIIRRALRHGHKLGQNQAFFYKLVADLDAEMAEAYPELREAAQRVADVLKQEEERFGETLGNGMKILEAALLKNAKILDGVTAFNLSDTYGFPIDLTADICREREIELDMAGYEIALEDQKNKGRKASGFGGRTTKVEYTGAKNTFIGYEHLSEAAKVLALYVDGVAVNAITAGQDAMVVLDSTPFYAESGGQCGDAGVLSNEQLQFVVDDTLKVQADVFGHYGNLASGSLAVGDAVHAQVDGALRARIVRHHSATHLMHKALREVLGSHVAQKGSQVDSEKTRFDFSHSGPMTAAEIAQVEVIVNREILNNVATQAQVMAFDDAVKHGAMALFGEKYGDTVRVLDIGTSRELCGGTHVTRTGDIGFFKIIAEGGVASGVRRVEAVCGEAAVDLVQGMSRRLQEAASSLKAQPEEITHKIGQIQDHVKALEKEVAALKSKLAAGQGDELLAKAVEVHGIKVLAAVMEGVDAAGLRDAADKMKDKLKTAAIVLASVADGKISLLAAVTADSTNKIKAGDLIGFVAKQVGGKGGGRADMAQGGGTDVAALPAALAAVLGFVQEKLAAS